MKKVKSFLINKLNRNNFRFILSSIYSFIASIKQMNVILIYYKSSEKIWIHKSLSGAYNIDSFPNFSISSKKFEKHVNKTFFKNYTPSNGDVIVDVGAGIGTLLLPFYKQIGEAGKIFAIEAHPQTFNCLNKLIFFNKWENTIVASNCAVSDKSGVVFISDDQNHSANSIQNKAFEGFKVEALTLDKYIENNKIVKIDFLKMNIEGAEKPAMLGMNKTLTITNKIAISCHDKLADIYSNSEFRTKDFVINYLESHGFKIVDDYCEKVDHWVYAQKIS